MSEQKQLTDEKAEFAAYVGIDWADQKHVWSLRVTATGKREDGEVEHSPEAVEAWINGWMAFPRTADRRLFGAIARGAAKYVEQVPAVGLISGSPRDGQPVPCRPVSFRSQG